MDNYNDGNLEGQEVRDIEPNSEECPTMPPAFGFFTAANKIGATSDVPDWGFDDSLNNLDLDGSVKEPPQAPVLNNDNKTVYTHFRSKHTPITLYNRLKALLQSYNCELKSIDSKYKFKVKMLVTGGHIKFNINCQVDPDDTSITHVTFNRLGGDGIQFRCFYASVLHQLNSLILPSVNQKG